MNKLNWPTAFVIVAIIFAGAFFYNKPTDAGLGSSEMIASGEPNHVWHFKNGKIRYCQSLGPRIQPTCSMWAN